MVVVERYSSYSSNHSPSFSSTLLDAIYRSVESSETSAADTCKDSVIRMKQKHSGRIDDQVFKSDEDMANYRRACMIEKWMEKKMAVDHDNKPKKPSSDMIKAMKASRNDQKPNSSSSSSSASSEAESLPVPRPKPVRTGCSRFGGGFGSDQGRKHEGGGFLKTKSKALKMYGDLKKARQQPISPGGKIAVFLNSLFSNGGNLKKTAKIAANGDDSPSLKSTNASTSTTTTTCSSASSFSRLSCLSKTPSSTRKTSNVNNGVKRSVRFSSVNMIIDDDDDNYSKSYGHKASNQDGQNGKKTSKDSIQSDINHQEEKNRPFDQDSDDDDDGASYASSDLFELDNLSSIGLMESSYRDELPVYETTRRPEIVISSLLHMR